MERTHRMFVEALKQFIYGWVFKWIKENIEAAEHRYAQKVIKKERQMATKKES